MNERTGDRVLQTEWYRVCSRLKAEIGDAAYDSWLKPVSIRGRHGDEVTISVPTRFIRDWIKTNYGERLRDL